MINIIDAILALDANAKVVVNDEPINQTEYEANVKYISGADENGSAIYKDTQDFSWAEVSAKKAELQSTYDNNEYQRKRKAEYPSIEDQLDKIYHDGVDKWKQEMIKPIKDKYPKE